MLGFIIGLLFIGLIAGFLARALVPGRDPLGIGGTILLGVAGSFVGGFLGGCSSTPSAPPPASSAR